MATLGASAAVGRGRWKALAVCLVGGFMVLLDVSIVNVALPSIRTGLSASQAELQWVVSGYALTFGLVLVPAGRLGDARGRRLMFVLALGAFTLASAACGAAQASGWLVAARLVQGMAGGALTPQITGFIQELFSGRERGVAFGLFGGVVGFSTALGPLLGGLLIAAFGSADGWRWVFYVNLPVGLVAIPVAWRLLPAPQPSRRHRHDLDPVGVLLLGSGVLLLLLPLVQEQQWHGRWKWLLLPAAALLLAGFVMWERTYTRRGREPLVELSLFRLRTYSFGTSLIALYFAGFTPLFFVFTLYLQIGLHYSALLAGLASMPFAAGSGVSAPLAGRAVHRLGRPLITAGLALVAAGLAGSVIAVHLAGGHGTGLATALPLLIAGLGSGMVIAPNQALTLTEVPLPRAGTAGGLLQTGQRIGAAIGIATAGAAFFAAVSAGHAPQWTTAYQRGVLVALCFVAAALVAALGEQLTTRRAAHLQREP